MKGRSKKSTRLSRKTINKLLILATIVIVIVIGIVIILNNKKTNDPVKTVETGLTLTDISNKMHNLLIKFAKQDSIPLNSIPSVKDLHYQLKQSHDGIVLKEIISTTPGLTEKIIKDINNTYNKCLNSNTSEEFENCDEENNNKTNNIPNNIANNRANNIQYII